MNDDSKLAFVRLGKAQVDAMFARQDEGPVIDDAEFLPLVEAVLTAFETVPGDAVANEVWEYAFDVYGNHRPQLSVGKGRGGCGRWYA